VESWRVVFKNQILILFLSLIGLLFINSLAYGQWTSVPPPSVSPDWELGGVHFTSANEGWTVGEDSANHRGVLFRFVPPPAPKGAVLSPDKITSVPEDAFGSVFVFKRRQAVFISQRPCNSAPA